jgi:hypothetical protein
MLKKIFKLYLWCVVILITMIAILHGWMWLTPPSVTALPALKDGDIVFQTSKTTQSIPIMVATGSMYSHVGVVRVNDKNEATVIEAVGPVREIPLSDWIAQGYGERISIFRINGIDGDAAKRVLHIADGYKGTPYDVYFLPEDNALYCSELVYEAYLRGINLMVGKEQQVKELHVDNMFVRHLIEQRWKTHPSCQDVQDFEACYQIIMSQRLVSPASIARNTQAELVYSNYGVFK